MLGVFLLLQTAVAPACATPDLCRLLQLGEAANRRQMLSGDGYTALIETESAVIARRDWRMEAPTRIEQAAGRARWSETGLDYRLVGRRNITNAIPLSRMALLRVGWVIPTLAGARLQLITRSGETSQAATPSGVVAPEIIVHPLAEDRERSYQYSGGALVRRTIDGTERDVLAVEVLPRPELTDEETLFEGELDLDPESHAVVRLLGQIRVFGRAKRGLRLPDFEPKATLVELVNQQLPDGSWVPRVQRFEVQTASSRKSGYGGVRRSISRWHEVEAIRGRSGGSGDLIGASTMGYQLSVAPGDSLQSFRGWRARPGKVTDSVLDEDFGRFVPDKLQFAGRPALRLQGPGQGDFFRFNRIEGLFTGAALTYSMRDAAPGLFLTATGGYGWAEKTVRGGASGGWHTPAWLVEAGAARTLDVTNKFRNQFDNPSLGALFGRDSWDYLGRTGVFAAITRTLEFSRGSSFRLEAARMTDDTVSRHMDHSLIRRRLRVNRNSAPGSYWRGRAVFDWNPEVSPLFTHDGFGVRAEVEQGSGDLDYTRVEARVVVRQTFSKIFFIARLHGGAVFAENPPPQQLFELGGPAGLPGYEYKEFAGNRAALFRMRLTRPLGLLDRPLRISSGISIPSLSPAISLGFQSGFADARGAGALAAVRALGDGYDDGTGAARTDSTTGQPLPAAVPTSKLRTSFDVRIGFFGDALAVGLARALEGGRRTRLIVAFGRQF